MIIQILFSLLLTIHGTKFEKNMYPGQDFDRSVFYEVMKSGGIAKINAELATVDAASIKEKDAYGGALLMKKAGSVKKPKDKISYFKAGRIRFQKAFISDSNNVEYHFLRLAIQEHAPKIVKYHGQLEYDSRYVQQFFKNLSPVARQAVIDYSKTSKVLHPESL